MDHVCSAPTEYNLALPCSFNLSSEQGRRRKSDDDALKRLLLGEAVFSVELSVRNLEHTRLSKGG